MDFAYQFCHRHCRRSAPVNFPTSEGGMLFLTLMLDLPFLFKRDYQSHTFSSYSRKNKHWKWLLVSGIIPLILSFAIWTGWARYYTWIIGLFVDIHLIFFGSALTLFASRVRGKQNFEENKMFKNFYSGIILFWNN